MKATFHEAQLIIDQVKNFLREVDQKLNPKRTFNDAASQKAGLAEKYRSWLNGVRQLCVSHGKTLERCEGVVSGYAELKRKLLEERKLIEKEFERLQAYSLSAAEAEIWGVDPGKLQQNLTLPHLKAEDSQFKG